MLAYIYKFFYFHFVQTFRFWLFRFKNKNRFYLISPRHVYSDILNKLPIHKKKCIFRRRIVLNLRIKKQKKRDRIFGPNTIRLEKYKQMKNNINNSNMGNKYNCSGRNGCVHLLCEKWLRVEIPRPTLSEQED